MLSELAYIEETDGLCIYRCFGEGAFLEIPSFVEGRPVTSLADHVFAAEPSFALRHVPKKRVKVSLDGAYFPGSSGGSGTVGDFGITGISSGRCAPTAGEIPEAMPMCAERLQSIVLPPTIQRIGDYAFYGCRNLRSVTMSAAMPSLGGGAFVAANHVRELVLVVEPGLSMPALRHALGEIAYEIEVRVVDTTGRDLLRLHFPEFYEDAVENTPARIFEMKFEGTGYRYRQCFIGDRPDFPRYDKLFYAATVQEFPETALQIAIDRLLYPVGLTPAAKESYLAYLREDMERFAAWCFENRGDARKHAGDDASVHAHDDVSDHARDDAMEILHYLTRETFFDREGLEIFLRYARERERADAVSLLGDYRRKHFTRARAGERYRL